MTPLQRRYYKVFFLFLEKLLIVKFLLKIDCLKPKIKKALLTKSWQTFASASTSRLSWANIVMVCWCWWSCFKTCYINWSLIFLAIAQMCQSSIFIPGCWTAYARHWKVSLFVQVQTLFFFTLHILVFRLDQWFWNWWFVHVVKCLCSMKCFDNWKLADTVTTVLIARLRFFSQSFSILLDWFFVCLCVETFRSFDFLPNDSCVGYSRRFSCNCFSSFFNVLCFSICYSSASCCLLICRHFVTIIINVLMAACKDKCDKIVSRQ